MRRLKEKYIFQLFKKDRNTAHEFVILMRNYKQREEKV